MDLVPYMYFEQQEAGSLLCAQHCLNNLLQQHTYTEFDLAEIAQRLDIAENAALDSPNQNKKSYNYDDTGYFSISVLERALQVWDLTLVRWRGEAMKPYQEHPEDQAAFILNLSSHWIPLRRFSPPGTSNAISKKRWYNLNSFFAAGPEWISPTYLRLVLTQAEQEGYSVFVVRKAGGSAEVDAGEAALGEGEGWGDGGVGIMPECEADRMALALGEPAGRMGGTSVGGGMGGGASGIGSSRVPLASVNPDQPTVDIPTPTTGNPSTSASPPPRPRRRRQPDLELSEDADPSDDPFAQPPSSSRRPTARGDDDDEDFSGPSYGGPTDFASHSRSYDDEDAAFQAALKASMEDVPAGWVAPDLSSAKTKTPAPVPSAPAQPERSASPPVAPRQNWRPAAASPPAVQPSGGSGGSKFREELEEEPTESLSPGEIRRRRLAKFGQ